MGQDESAWLDDLFHHAAHSLGDAHVPATRSPTRRTQNRSEARPPPLNPPRILPSTRHRKQSLPISRTGLPSAALPATKSYHPQPRVPAFLPPTPSVLHGPLIIPRVPHRTTALPPTIRQSGTSRFLRSQTAPETITKNTSAHGTCSRTPWRLCQAPYLLTTPVLIPNHEI